MYIYYITIIFFNHNSRKKKRNELPTTCGVKMTGGRNHSFDANKVILAGNIVITSPTEGFHAGRTCGENELYNENSLEPLLPLLGLKKASRKLLKDKCFEKACFILKSF